jgi:hypothetical protein
MVRRACEVVCPTIRLASTRFPDTRLRPRPPHQGRGGVEERERFPHTGSRVSPTVLRDDSW